MYACMYVCMCVCVRVHVRVRVCVRVRACVLVCDTEVKVSETTADVSCTLAKRKLQQQQLAAHQLITVTLVHKN